MLSVAEDPREHGDRPQRHARPVGLDARPRDPLDDLGVGLRLDLRAAGSTPTTTSTTRSRTSSARTATSATTSCASTPSSRGSRTTSRQPLYNVAPRAARSSGASRCTTSSSTSVRTRQQAVERRPRHELKSLCAQGAQAARQGLRRLPAARRPVGGAGVLRQPDREPRAQRLVAHDHLLRPLPRRRGDVRVHEESELDDETRGGWYVRQLMGSAQPRRRPTSSTS